MLYRSIVLVILCCCLNSEKIVAQVAERQVFASAGKSAGEFTIGEVFTATLSNETTLTQGFHQPELNIVNVQELETAELSIWPNPTKDLLHIQSDFIDYQWEILDAAGKTILEGNGVRSSDLSVSKLSRGMYLLRITSPINGVSESIQFIRL